MDGNYSSQDLGHLGLVAGIFKELGLVKLVDSLIPSKGKDVSHGNALCAMVLNGLGFTNQCLYLVPHFFQNKPVERLIAPGITADKLNDDALGRSLDAFYKFGTTEIYSELAARAVEVLGLRSKFGHVDSTSMHVDGVYNSEGSPPEGVIHIVPGYSRDHRPELNQIIINMIVESKGSLPIHMSSASGNSSDKNDFREIISTHVDNLENYFGVEYIVADSALYSVKTIQTLDGVMLFITRVPETIKDAKLLIKQADIDSMTEIDDNYRYLEVCSTYGQVKQRWILVHSQHAQKRELISLDKRYFKGSEKEQKSFKKLTKQVFACEEDALKAFAQYEKKLRFTVINELKVMEHHKYSKPGKPKKGTKPDKIVYQLEGAVASCLQKKAAMAKSKGYFILATNELDSSALAAEEIFFAYKDQGKVERGFRFLKNPEFLASSLFLKKPERIMALAMVMTVCLMVYAALEYKIREKLASNKQTFPNQLNQKISNPTARWVFHCFTGIHLLHQPDGGEVILNLNEQHRQIIDLLGYHYFYS